MEATPASVKFTYDDVLTFRADGRRHEIIDGEHYVTPSPNTKHQTIVFNLTTALGSYLRAHPLGAAFSAPFDVVFVRAAELSVEHADTLTTPLLPGFSAILADVFASRL